MEKDAYKRIEKMQDKYLKEEFMVHSTHMADKILLQFGVTSDQFMQAMAKHKLLDSDEVKQNLHQLDQRLADRITRVLQQPEEGDQAGGFAQQN